MAEEQQWYYLNGEEQTGPCSPEDLQQLAAAGYILPETQLWTEGLEQWIPATQVEGLFAAPEVAVYPQEKPVDHSGEFSPAGADFPPPGPMKASYAWFIVLPVLAILSMVGGIALIVARVSARADEAGKLVDQDVFDSAMEAVGLLLITTSLFSLFFLIFTILKMIVIHRAWRALQHGPARTTPGKAVGFLFIPIFNFYWRFVAYLGLAKDWNRIHAAHPNLVGAPQISVPLVAIYCILSTLFFLAWPAVFISTTGSDDLNSPFALPIMIVGIVSLILELVFLAGVCRLINFMGRLHLRQAQPPTGGFKIY